MVERGREFELSRLLIVDTCRTKKDPFVAVFEGEVVRLLRRRRLRLRPSITAGGDTALACLIHHPILLEAAGAANRHAKNLLCQMGELE